MTPAVVHNIEGFEAADADALQQAGGATAEEWQARQNASPHNPASSCSELWLQPDIDSLRSAIAHAASVNAPAAPAAFVEGEAGTMPDSGEEDARATQQDNCYRDSSDSSLNGSSAASMHKQTESTGAGWWPYLRVPAAAFALACLVWWLNSDTTTSEAEQAEDDR